MAARGERGLKERWPLRRPRDRSEEFLYSSSMVAKEEEPRFGSREQEASSSGRRVARGRHLEARPERLGICSRAFPANTCSLKRNQNKALEKGGALTCGALKGGRWCGNNNNNNNNNLLFVPRPSD
ncbi:Hypothetical predicted protein [Podarcis lilfordi]|uniref:Uncharacterized protein n=1 Tax=Podarcis lilfordi TaxID=74358 RepID=A0AA35LGP3_9SAUR|nr:Hypothetical predicted protein [Podarcis lilfordi]